MKPVSFSKIMKKTAISILVTILFASFCLQGCSNPNKVDLIEKEFFNPPDWAKPHTWWHFVDGHVSKEGITKDMESWKEVGIGGFQHFMIGWRIPFGGVEYNSPEFHKYMAHAMSEADRLGLEAAFNSAAGWSSTGGPWVKPEHSMKMIVWSETKIKGGSELTIQLPLPKLNKKQQAYNFYREIAVIAFPTPKNDQYRLPSWEAKSLTELRARSDKFIPTFEEAPLDAVIAAADVQNISNKMDDNGLLIWDAPKGNWTVLRIGFTTTGATTKPGTKGGLGLEIDKMSREAADVHWDELVEKMIEDADGKKALQTILIDSYEVGHQNWTDDFPKLFESKNNYDIIPNLLCMTGRIVQSTDYTERFLWDVRKTVSEFTYQNYFLYFKEKSHQRGLLLACEPYGTGSFDASKVAKMTDLTMTEFWIRETPWFRRNLWEWTGQIVSSAAHLTGKSVVGAEAFTRMQGDWTAHPYHMKIVGDRALANGVNRYLFHTSVHQPWNDDVKPGFTMGQFGTQFHRNNTWFYRATRVNMIWVAPGVTKPGTTSVKPVNLLDIYPTLASLTGIKPPDNQLEGKDLSVLMKDPGASGFETTLTTFGYKNYAVRSEQYRYIVYADGSEELYDHQNDRWEWHNLANNLDYVNVKNKLSREIPIHHEPTGILQLKWELRGWKPKK